mgnify:FL=1
MKKMVCVCLSLVLMMGAVACEADTSAEGNEAAPGNTAAASETVDLKSENEMLKAENEELKKKLAEYEKAEQEKKENETVQEGDVTVQLTGKTESTDYLSRQFVNFVFTVKNNTEKSIKGVQGKAVFKDLFGDEILTMNCDFVGNTIEPGVEITISDLSMECNRFMNDHVKLYNTALDDLQFEYQLTSIVFTDGTTKQ